MKKRIVSMFLCLCMAFTLVGALVPTARAITDEEKREIDEFEKNYRSYINITENNPYYHADSGRGTQYFKGTRTWQCTAYVWQRIYNDLGFKLSESGWGNAKNWFDKAYKAGYDTGYTPKPNSIVVYDGVWYKDKNGKDVEYGHVALVTAVNGNTMTVDEAGRTGTAYRAKGGIADGEVTAATKRGDVRWRADDGRHCKVLGYIYLPVHVDSPAAPTNLTGKWTSRGPQWQAEISWNPVSGATGYHVQYRTPAMGNNEWKTDGDYKSGNSYISKGLGRYDYYEYRVQAYNAGGKSTWMPYTLPKYGPGSGAESTEPTTPTPSTPPAKPGNLSAGWTICRGMNPRVSWNAVSGAESYKVQYKKANESVWCSAPTTFGTSYTFLELGMDASWNFRVEAVNAAGSSGWTECSLSAPQNIIADLLKKDPSIFLTVAAPTSVSGRWTSTGSNAAAELTWNPVNDVDRYEVSYKKDGGNWVDLSLCIMNTKRPMFSITWTAVRLILSA